MHTYAVRCVLLAIGATAGALCYALTGVRADGAPTQQPLWYSGTVSDAQGHPLTGAHNVTVRLFDTDLPTAEALCVVGPRDVGFDEGRFRIDVSSCNDKQPSSVLVASKPDLFVGLTVDDATKPFKPAKVGAVPYALEAQHALSAGRAAPGSDLEKRIAALEVRSGFRATAPVANGDLPVGWSGPLKLTAEQFDLNAEYEPSTGLFVPKRRGLYMLSCQAGDEIAATGNWWTGLFVNGAELHASGNDNIEANSNRTVATVALLGAGDRVSCEAYGKPTHALTKAASRLSFAAALVSPQ